MFLFLVTSFIAGILTVLAPCVLPLLPIIVGGGAGNNSRKPLLVLIGSLSLSIIIFTLLLRASTLLIDIPQSTWSYISGVILIFFGIITLFPTLWEKVSVRFDNSSQNMLNNAAATQGSTREMYIGLALGPVFTSCSPTYALIIATVLPASFGLGVLYTVVYALGLAVVLYLIGILGSKFTAKLRGAADPHSWFKKSLGIIFLLVGIAIFFGWEKRY